MSQGEINRIKRFDVKSFGTKSISSNFEIVKIRDVIEKQPQYWANERAIDWNKEIDFRYIRITDIDEFWNLKDDERKTAEKVDKKYIVNENDLLFARSWATAWKCYYVPKNIRWIFAWYMIRFVLNPKKCISKYLFYLTFTDFYKKRVEKISRAAAQPNINSQEYLDFEFPLPPLKTQQEIVDRMDKAIAEKKKMELESEKALECIDNYLLSELWIKLSKQNEEKNYFIVNLEDIRHGRFDVDFCKHIIQSKEIKWKYETVKIKDVAQEIRTWLPIRKDQRISDWNIPYYWANGIIWYMNDFTHDWEYLVVSQDWYIWNHYVVSGKFWASNHNRVMKVKEWINIHYVKAILDITNYEYLITWWVIPKLTKESLETIEIPLPQKEIQDEIANEVKSKMEKANELKKQANEIYEKTRDEIEKMILVE